jgi:hypothetical protein
VGTKIYTNIQVNVGTQHTCSACRFQSFHRDSFLKKCFHRPKYIVYLCLTEFQKIFISLTLCFLKSFAYEVRGWCMIAALTETDALVYVKQIRGIEGRTEKMRPVKSEEWKVHW